MAALLALLFGTVLGPLGGRSAVCFLGTLWGLLVEIVGVIRPKINPNNSAKQSPQSPLNGPKRRAAISREFATPSRAVEKPRREAILAMKAWEART